MSSLLDTLGTIASEIGALSLLSRDFFSFPGLQSKLDFGLTFSGDSESSFVAGFITVFISGKSANGFSAAELPDSFNRVGGGEAGFTGAFTGGFGAVLFEFGLVLLELGTDSIFTSVGALVVVEPCSEMDVSGDRHTGNRSLL
jgi:hypothetical protein